MGKNHKTLVGLMVLFFAWGWVPLASYGQGIGPSPAVVVKGDLPLWHTGQLLPRQVRAGAAQQINDLLDQLQENLRHNGSSPERLVKVNFYLANQETAAALGSKRRTTPKP